MTMGKRERSAYRKNVSGSSVPVPVPAQSLVSRKVVFVLGPPRSGTSAISHVIERLGVSFGDPRNFVDPAEHPHNPVFFELRSVNGLNERICRRLGATYAEFALLPVVDSYSDAMHREFREEIVALVHEEFGDTALIGVKDPRFVITLPFWQQALAAQGYEAIAVVTERDTQAAKQSNREVNRSFSDDHNQRIVELSKLLAAWQAQRLPSLLVDFDQALADANGTVLMLSRFLGIADADLAKAVAVLDPRHRHHPGVSSAIDGLSPDAGSDLLARRAVRYEALVNELGRLGALDLLSTLVRDRDQALSGMEHSELARHAAEDQFQMARGLAADYAAGYANLQALLPLSPVLRPPSSVLYLPDESGALSEVNSLQAELRSRQAVHLAVFRLAAASLGRSLRFDPDIAPGVYRLDAILVDGKPLSELDARIEQGSSAEPGHVSRFAVAENDDPWWRLDLSGCLPDGVPPNTIVELQIEFRRMNAATLAGDAAAVRVKAALEPMLSDGFERSLDAISTQTITLAARSDDIAARTDALAAASEVLSGQGLEHIARAEALAIQTHALAAKAEVLGAALVQLHSDSGSRHEQAMQAFDAWRLDALQATAEADRRIDVLEQGVAGVGVVLAGTRAQLEGLQGQLDALAAAFTSKAAASDAAIAQLQADSSGRHGQVVQGFDALRLDARQATADAGRRIDSLEQGVVGVSAGLAGTQGQLEGLKGRLDDLATAQQRLLGLAERRTFAFWWRRWFGAKAERPSSDA
jgi:hypothetical protein